MTHLDAELKKQNAEFLKSLITDQVTWFLLTIVIILQFSKFQGTQVYSTICHSCENRSEKTSEFLELEISFKARRVLCIFLTEVSYFNQNNIRLEDCIAASLSPETLSGDNQYKVCLQSRSSADLFVVQVSLPTLWNLAGRNPLRRATRTPSRFAFFFNAVCLWPEDYGTQEVKTFYFVPINPQYDSILGPKRRPRMCGI